MSGTGPYKYYPQPTSVNINDEGAISLEWCKPNARVGLYVDSTDRERHESIVYAIYTRLSSDNKIEQELFDIWESSDVVKVLNKLGLIPK